MTAVLIQGFAPEVTADIEVVVEYLEGNHGDTVQFIATQHERVGVVVDATVACVDPTGVSFDLIFDSGTVEQRRFEFATPIDAVVGLQAEMRASLAAARAADPGHPVTSIEAETASRGSLVSWRGAVRAVRPVVDNIVELTIGGLDAMPVLGGDEFLYVLVARPGVELAVQSGMTMSQIQQLGPDQNHGAYYTTRRRRTEVGEIDLWVFLHGADVGVSAWAARARPGDPVALWGPRRGHHPPEDTTSHLLICDESGIAACAAIIETLAPNHPVTVVAEVVDHEHEPPLPRHDDLTVHWVHRVRGAPSRLAATVRSLDLRPEGLYAFGAAESREISAVRRYLRGEMSLATRQVHMTGYWRAALD